MSENETLVQTSEQSATNPMAEVTSSQNISVDALMNSVSKILENEFENALDLDDASFESLFEQKVGTIKEDQLIKGKIVKIVKDEVFVDIGFKSFGVVPKAELINAESYHIGDEIDVYIEKMEDSQGRVLLSRRRADFMRIWDDILKLYETQEVTRVKILRRIKGGMVVDLLGIEAFLPGSQIDVRPVRDFDSWVGKNIDVRVVKVNHPSENVVVSHKVLLEEQLSEQRQAIMDKLDKGLVLEGTVKAISDFGVFVDLGGVDGLVHITDLSWGRVTHPSEIVELDQTVKVVVLDFDKEKKRISLGMKQLTPHPWDTIGDKYEKGTKVVGKVVSLTDYGAFIEIEKGVEGLIHISEMSWTQHVKHPSQIVSMGQVVEAIVLNIDKEEKKLALGMKQLEPDPWEDLMKKYPIGSKHKGIVRNLTNFGVFVELEPGVDGLVHISDLSWTKKIRHPGEFVKKGDELEVVVISVDPEQRRIALGHKQINDNPWDTFEETYKIGTETEAKIERIIEKGVIVELPERVDGFVPVSQLSFAPVKNISEYFKIGDVLPLKVVEFDKEAKKIVLSVVECLRDKPVEVIEAYNSAHPVPNADKYSKGEMSPDELPTYNPEDIQTDIFNYEYPPDYLPKPVENKEEKTEENQQSIESTENN
ncbi:MAG TPA: 30S ribosomal protein S1 [Candidatus Kapabacteria bacterium]|nr:30S ribosomal protein S1 [Candidatus Kapabacteria bacterium]HPP38748.1 30S ribosomal protein S1 [Candidatus Kapabacteria bacterium]HPU23700.1 30S ribosomal protein S1 [Candidatus Kapabacteria bacterium]